MIYPSREICFSNTVAFALFWLRIYSKARDRVWKPSSQQSTGVYFFGHSTFRLFVWRHTVPLRWNFGMGAERPVTSRESFQSRNRGVKPTFSLSLLYTPAVYSGMKKRGSNRPFQAIRHASLSHRQDDNSPVKRIAQERRVCGAPHT